MARAARATRGPRGPSEGIWPGFVDALSTLLLGVIFLIVVLMLAHFFLAQALTGRDEALTRLNAQIAQLTDMLAIERKDAVDARAQVGQLAASLQAINRERAELQLRLRDATARATTAETALAEANRTVQADRETMTARLAEIERLNRDIAALRQVRDRLEEEVAALTLAMDRQGADADRANARLTDLERQAALRAAALEATLRDLTTLRDRGAELEARAATAEERTILAQRELQQRDLRLAEVQALYNRTQTDLQAATATLTMTQQEKAAADRLTTEAQMQVALLNQQLGAMREQLLALQEALNAAEAKDKEAQVVIENLGARLNLALAQRVEELAGYRSEFFGRLRQLLGDRPDVRVVGDRFVFQSEVLFDAGNDQLGEAGKAELAKFAQTLISIANTIPREIPWVLRVDGHTDVRPIATARFPSNWELSTARAVSVVKFLVEQGVPVSRLAATGFGEYQPIDPSNDEIAYRRNRRIELKLTER
ncbi:MAG: peptidoglycan -binding protein [Alphaproteobacteria bacterium]|nr:peptidoglycan -binding protein [Alphaproteobacteria bacterium]